MRWEAFCRALSHKCGQEPPAVFPLDPPPENPAELANAASELLKNPVFRLALDRVQERLVNQWRHSTFGNKDEREATYLLHASIDELRAELQRMTTLARRPE